MHYILLFKPIYSIFTPIVKFVVALWLCNYSELYRKFLIFVNPHWVWEKYMKKAYTTLKASGFQPVSLGWLPWGAGSNSRSVQIFIGHY